MGRNNCGVFEYVVFGSSSTGVPSDLAADQPKV